MSPFFYLITHLYIVCLVSYFVYFLRELTLEMHKNMRIISLLISYLQSHDFDAIIVLISMFDIVPLLISYGVGSLMHEQILSY